MSLTLRTAMPALLLASSTGNVLAQQPAAEKASAPNAAAVAPKPASISPAPSAAAASSAGGLSYRSAFEGYRPLNDQPVLPWRESNDVVGRIGGWQSYAREGQGGAPAGTAEMPAPAASQGKPAMPAMSAMPGMPDMPAGHEGMKMAPPGSAAPAPMAPMGSNADSSKAPMKMPASRPDPASSSASPKPAPAAVAASAAMPGGHTGHQQP